MIDGPEEQVGDDARIGVGMGGSCPSCRAPVDLGQEFCLECGAPIRFSARQRRTGAAASTTTSAAAGGTPAQRGFPWLPFVIVLALLAAGVAVFAMDDRGDDSRSSGRDGGATTEPPLPSITNSAPETSSEATTTVEDCSDADPLAGTQPTRPGGDVAEDPGALGSTGETIPELAPSPGMLGDNDPAGDPFGGEDIPDTQPRAEDAAVTVDRDGNPCGDSGAGDGFDGGDTNVPDDSSDLGDPGIPSGSPSTSAPSTSGRPATTPTSPGGATTPAATDPTSSTTSWPDRDGWTVVVFGFPEEDRANARAADLQADGFESGVLFSTDYGSLCPGFYVVFSGVYATETQARNQEKRLRGKYQGMYVRKITREGTPTGCRS